MEDFSEVLSHELSRVTRWGAPRAYNGLRYGWIGVRVGTVRGSARALQGAEIAGVGLLWLCKRGCYDLARGYNATSRRAGNRLGNIAPGNAPYRPRPSNAGAPMPWRAPMWVNWWPERR